MIFIDANVVDGVLRTDATTVDARNCASLVTLDAPLATYVDASGCRSLATLDAPLATYVDARGCTSLVRDRINAPVARQAEKFVASKLLDLLGADGRLSEALKPEHWSCHNWTNCPMAAAFDVTSEDAVPTRWRADADLFVQFYDCGLITAKDAGVTC